jgi:hypothetical protein
MAESARLMPVKHPPGTEAVFSGPDARESAEAGLIP